MISADTAFPVALDAKNIDPSGGDVDLTTTFAGQAFVRGLYNGAAVAASFRVVNTAGNTVNYANVPAGGFIYGMFVTLRQTGTTATGVVAEK